MCDTWSPRSETEVECSDEHVVVAMLLLPMMLENEGSLVIKLLSLSVEWFS